MQLKTLTVGTLSTNCYLIWCNRTNEAVVIDPGLDRLEEAERLSHLLEAHSLKVRFVVDTHGHPDHTCGNGIVQSRTGAPILIHKLDADMLGAGGKALATVFGFHAASPTASRFLKEGNQVSFGNATLRVLHTPGHSPGSISLVGEKCVFTGDTLFAGSIGRVDLPRGSGKEIMQSIQQKLVVLPDRFAVYPGHGPKSTIGQEKSTNPFLRNFGASLQ